MFAKSIEVEASPPFTLSKFFSSLKIDASISLLFVLVETKKQRTTSQEQGLDSDLLLLFYFFFHSGSTGPSKRFELWDLQS